MGRSAYGIVRPVPGKAGAHGAGGPFDTKKLLETMSKKRKENRNAEQAKGAAGGLQTIIAKKDDKKVGKIVDKFKKDVTIKPSPAKSTVSMSDVDLSVRSSGDFESTLKQVQSQVASDAFNVMQLIVRTMTGLFPVSIY